MDYRLQRAYGSNKPYYRQQDIVTSNYARIMSHSLLWMTIDSFLFYQRLFDEMEHLMIHSPDWFRETTQMFNDVQEVYELYVKESGFAKEETLLSKDYRKEIELELLNLSRITISDIGVGDLPSNNLIIEIKDAVQKGNRTNFKLIQELQLKLEELSEGSIGNLQETSKAVIDEASRKTKELTKLLLDIFDLLELVRISALVKKDELWDKELNLVVTKGLDMLHEYGLEEITVLGQLFDGEIMEGISTISMDELPSNYQRYQVYAVTQRGFRYKCSEELVRKAKVTTVY